MARLSCGVQCTRTLLLMLNLVLLLIGCSVMGAGIYLKANGSFPDFIALQHVAQALGEETMRSFGKIMITVGAVTAGLAIFGCLGASCHSRALLYIYSVVLLLIILLQFVSMIVTLRLHNDLWKSYDSGFRNVFHRAHRHNQTQVIQLIAKLEQEFQCCGVDSSTDYIRSGYRIPPSCYPNQWPQGAPFKAGCAEAMVIWAWNELPMIIGVLGSLLLIEIFGTISSLVVAVAISHSLNTDAYDKL